MKLMEQNSQKYFFKELCGFLLLILLGILSMAQTVYANDQYSPPLKVEIESNEGVTNSKNIQLSPELNKEYHFLATIVNMSHEVMDVDVFSSIGVSTNNGVAYVKNTKNLLNPDYDLGKYVKIQSDDGELKDGIIRLAANQSKKVRITIKMTRELEGEILGGINFSQVLKKKDNNKSVGIIQVYQKVITVRLKLNRLTEQKSQTYDNFKFVNTSDNVVSLGYYVTNNNPLVVYANAGSYKVINPNQKVIAEGNLEKDHIILAPLIKTQLSVPLLDQSELVSGYYQFIVTEDGEETSVKFLFSRDQIEKLAEKVSVNSNVVVKSKKEVWIRRILVAVIIVLTILVTKLYIYNKKA